MIKLLLLGGAFCITLGECVQAQNTALSFNGTADYIEVANASQLNFSNELTTEAWVQLDKIHGQNIIFSKSWCGSSQFAYTLSIVDGKLRWVWNNNGNCNYSSYVESNDVVFYGGECHHIAVVHSSTGVLLYIDGIVVPHTLIQGSYSNIMASNEPLRMGIYRGLSGDFMYFMDGQLDELKFWDVQRTSAQINYSMHNALVGNEPNLVAYYDFDNLIAGSFIHIQNKAIATGSILNAMSSATSPLIIGSCAQLSGLPVSIAASELQLSVYPNPALSLIQIVSNQSVDQLQITLFDAFGKVVAEANLSGTKTQIVISELAPGVYYIKTKLSDSIYKIVKN